ncbi:MAG TPA: cellulase family glycosylhydrolase, partial [Chloroflexia bacterium]|nr:cellulase family glycosylhydrolase [Chloroflexia bacterium]
MTQRPRRFTTQILLCLILAPLLVQQAGTGRAEAPAAFASPLFEGLWARTDGPVASGAAQRSWLWGPSPGATRTEQFASGGRRERLVQYFDKARMEVNAAVTDERSPWRVTTGLLVSEMVEGRAQVGDNRYRTLAPAQQTVAGDPGVAQNPRYVDFEDVVGGEQPDRTGLPITTGLPGHRPLANKAPAGVIAAKYIPETARNIPGVLWEYLNGIEREYAAGAPDGAEPLSWVYLMGYPITEAYWFDLRIGGKTYPALIQLYQRRVLTYVPAFTEVWRVQMGNVGQDYYQWRYTQASVSPDDNPADGLPPLLPAEGSFVGIQDASFTYRGQKVKLKGTNYWLSQAPFVGTWSEWNGPRVQMELEKAKQLSVNSVRVGIPYDHKDSFDVVWGDDKEKLTVSPWIKDQMTQFLQIAASYDMKVIFVLFEWYDRYPAKGSRDERSNIAYINGIVSAFANDDRVLAWDLHNEPDNYEEWRSGGADGIIEWLGRMAGYVRHLDRRHPITVGVGKYESLWWEGPGGLRMLDFVDFASFHTYDAG